MKKLLLSFSALLFVTSCSIVNFKDVKSVTSVAVPPAIQLAVNKEPSSVEYFKAASVAIRTFASSEEIDPAAFEAMLDSTGINEIRSPEAKAAISTIVSAYKTYYSEKVNNKNKNLIEYLNILADAIDAGIE